MRPARIAVVTGTRAEFGIWEPVLRAILASKRLKLQLLVTGMHLLPEFGSTANLIVREGFEIAARVPMYEKGEPVAESLARGIRGFAAAFRESRPDLVMVLGDRLEMLAAASAALTERIAIGHVHGGETAPGIWDEQIRHAITKMAHLHFCATAGARMRTLRMGEDPKHVHLVGAPALDKVEEFWRGVGPIVSKVRSYRRQGKRGPEVVMLLHPSGDGGATDEAEFKRASMLIGVLQKADILIQAIGPNNDPGHGGILRAYQRAGVDVEMNVPQERFWHLVACSSALVGNSSSGIIESASLGVPAINIGGRQAGRERNGNVIDVEWDEGQIERALRKALSNRGFMKQVWKRKNLYGDGKAAARIVRILEQSGSGINRIKHFGT